MTERQTAQFEVVQRGPDIADQAGRSQVGAIAFNYTLPKPASMPVLCQGTDAIASSKFWGQAAFLCGLTDHKWPKT